MRLTRPLYRLSMLNPKVEFILLPCFMLFSPWKDSPLYFPATALLIVLLSLRNICFMKNLSLSSFSYSLLAFNLLAILSVFFAVYRRPAILWVSGIFLISLYFILFFLDKGSEDGYFHLLIYIISAVSLFQVIDFIIPGIDRRNFFFPNPIYQGVASGIAVLAALYYLLKKFHRLFFGLLVLNVAGVYVSQSKAAFIGTAGICLLMALLKQKKLIPAAAGLILLTFIIPNPIREMFIFSIKQDPYSANRTDIWKMSLDIYKDHPLFGVGPENFSEVSRQYNFKQTRGPANYFKRPRSPHSDYFKLLSETGSAGLIFIFFFGFVLVKRIVSLPLFNLSTLLILYLLFQALVFDVIFHFFFFFIFLFLLKNLFEQQLIYKSFTLPLKVNCIFILVITFTAGYLLPYFSHGLAEKSQKTQDIVARFNLSNRAGYLDPLDADIHYLKAVSLYHYFNKTTNLESFYSALENVKKVQRLNPYFIDAYWLESDLYAHLLQENVSNEGLREEITAPLAAAERYDPSNPFLKLRKAEIDLRFDFKVEARQEAIKSLELEPDYAMALYFLQRNYNYFPDEGAFETRIARIREKAAQYRPEPGTYLYKLFEIPMDPSMSTIKHGTGEVI
ncbi:MAG: O-antigen ligase family protein [Candidatus Aminicenantes bacterium]|nr:O-antigen ligase family protein [Candidatus Aminicenantes bacterium]